MTTIINFAASPAVGHTLGRVIIAVLAAAPGWVPLALVAAFGKNF